MNTCGVVAKNKKNRYLCVVQRYYPGPDNLFKILKNVKNGGFLNHQSNNLTDLKQLIKDYNGNFNYINRGLNYSQIRLNRRMRENSDYLNENLVKKIFKRLYSETELDFLINSKYDFNYIISFPKGTKEMKIDEVTGRQIKETCLECAMREWDEETLLKFPKGEQPDEEIPYFEFLGGQKFKPNGRVRENPEEIIGTIYLTEEQIRTYIALKKSNTFTANYFGMENRKVLNWTDEDIKNFEQGLYFDSKFKPIRIENQNLISTFSDENILSIIIEELKEYRDNGFQPQLPAATQGLKNKRKTKKGKSKKNKSQRKKTSKSSKKKSPKKK